MAYFGALNPDSEVCRKCAFKFSAHFDDGYGMKCPTVTGRMPSRDPSFQNILIRTEEGTAIKNALKGSKEGQDTTTHGTMTGKFTHTKENL